MSMKAKITSFFLFTANRLCRSHGFGELFVPLTKLIGPTSCSLWQERLKFLSLGLLPWRVWMECRSSKYTEMTVPLTDFLVLTPGKILMYTWVHSLMCLYLFIYLFIIIIIIIIILFYFIFCLFINLFLSQFQPAGSTSIRDVWQASSHASHGLHRVPWGLRICLKISEALCHLKKPNSTDSFHVTPDTIYYHGLLLNMIIEISHSP